MPIALIVDDEPLPRLAIQRVLQHKGWKAMTVGTVEDAKLLLRHSSVQLILIDVMMKDEIGTDAARDLGALAPEATLVLMSGYTPAMLQACGVTLGRAHFLQKPVDSGELDTVLLAAS